MTDHETQAAIDALAHRVRERDAEIQDANFTDADVFALEFITALRGRGWRVTNTAPPEPHTAGAGLPHREDAVAAVAELRRRLATPPAAGEGPDAA